MSQPIFKVAGRLGRYESASENPANNATHSLVCSQSCPKAQDVFKSYIYHMPCIILKRLLNNRVKVLVYGYKLDASIKKTSIRYVDEDRLIKIPSEIK